MNAKIRDPKRGSISVTRVIKQRVLPTSNCGIYVALSHRNSVV